MRVTVLTAVFHLLLLVGAQASAQTVYTFTTGGATGTTGPDQTALDTAYSGTTLDGLVTSSAGIQEWTIPTTGNYLIEAYGGQGFGSFGGRGAHISGEFALTAGTAIKVLVGHQGVPYLNFPATTYNNQYGGAGGSFVTLSDNTPLVVAGGGGGSHASSFLASADGQITNDGAAGVGPLAGAGGTAGGGGAQAVSADGGGGLLGNGAGIAGGQAFVNGGNGGFDEGFGGFGGGGGTSSWNNYRGGGGGGYSGGGGGNDGTSTGTPTAAGGGGGSFNSGNNPVNLAGVQLGDGLVRITLLAPSFSAAFAPGTIELGQVSTLTFTIDNTAFAAAATALDFTNNLPAGLEIADPANASTTCTGGTLTATAAATVITYTGGTVAAGGSCTVAVDVLASAPGVLNNVSGDLTSSIGNSGTAEAPLTVNTPPPPAPPSQPVEVPTLPLPLLALLGLIISGLGLSALGQVPGRKRRR